MPRSMNMNKIRFDSFVKQYKVKYELLKTQTLKQSKTIKEDIVLLPFDLEHKTIHHALCNGFLAVFSLCLYAILQHVFKISAISTHVVFECNMPMVNGQRQQHVRLFNAAVPTFSLRGRCHKISQSCNMMSTALRQWYNNEAKNETQKQKCLLFHHNKTKLTSGVHIILSNITVKLYKWTTKFRKLR